MASHACASPRCTCGPRTRSHRKPPQPRGGRKESHELLHAGLAVVMVLLAAAALVLPWLVLEHHQRLLVWVLLAVPGTLVVAAIGWRRANRLLREKRQGGGPG